MVKDQVHVLVSGSDTRLAVLYSQVYNVRTRIMGKKAKVPIQLNCSDFV